MGPHLFVADDLIWVFTPLPTPGIHSFLERWQSLIRKRRRWLLRNRQSPQPGRRNRSPFEAEHGYAEACRR